MPMFSIHYTDTYQCEAPNVTDATKQFRQLHADATITTIDYIGDKRLAAYQRALSHWMTIGYSYNTARALAAVLHGQDDDVKAWATSIMLAETNLTLADMI